MIHLGIEMLRIKRFDARQVQKNIINFENDSIIY